MSPTYEFCSIRYLWAWQRTQSKLHEELSQPNPDGDSIKAALVSYKVHRNFGKLDEGKCDKISELLTSHSRYLTLNNVASKVEELADAFYIEFGSNNLSAASKLLWLRKRSPVVIFDSRARKALLDLEYDFDPSDYSGYLECWREEFADREAEIRHAAARLPEINEFTGWQHSIKELKELVTSDWFVKQIFDTYLWETGRED